MLSQSFRWNWYREKQKNLLLQATSFTAQQSEKLPYQTHLQVGGEYFISTNIDVSDLLFHGSTEILCRMEFSRTHSNLVGPTAAWIDFRHAQIGVKCRGLTEKEQQEKYLSSLGKSLSGDQKPQ